MIFNIFIVVGIVWLMFYSIYSAYKKDRSPQNISLNLIVTFTLFTVSLLLADKNDYSYILVLVSIAIIIHNISIFFGRRKKK
jgi:RsiW-degrading membrane proteinase PrsW (M82 family)